MATIRQAAAADAQTLAKLLGQLGYEASAAAIPSRIDAIEKGGGIVLVAIDDANTVVGAASGATLPTLHADQPTAYITALVTTEGSRRRGIGRQLVAAVESWALDTGCRRLSVTSAEHRTDAHAFYVACGFPYVGRRFTKTLLQAAS